MKRMILVDGNSLMYRAYYGMKTPLTSKGLPTNAILGFIRMMNYLLNQKYDNILVAFDAGKKTLRHDLMKDYKAGRPPMPDDFRVQIAYIKEFLNIVRVKQYEQELYEADDIIGTMAKKAEDLGYHVDIYSSDKDLLQLVSPNVTVHMNKKGMTEMDDYTPESFKERYNIDYKQFIDLKGLMGDKSDNLPGIPGIGEVKAVKLLNTYGSIENMIEHKDEIKGADGEKIRNNYESAILCKKMATIIRDFDIKITLDDTRYQEPNKEGLKEFYRTLEFKSLLREIEDSKLTIDEGFKYKIINDSNDLNLALDDNTAFYIETFEYNYHRCPILCIAFANKNGVFVLDGKDVLKFNELKTFFEDQRIKYTYDIKKDYVLLKRLNIILKNTSFDLLLGTYILTSSNLNEFKDVANFYDYIDVSYDEEIYGKGVKKAIPDMNFIYQHVAKKAKCILEIKDDCINKLKENNQLHLLNDIEIPLSIVLAKMEYNGFKVDLDELSRQQIELEKEIKELENKIYELAGHEFNVSSPKQLGTVLFDELNIPYPKRKTGSYSTDVEILETIKNLNPIVDYIMRYRNKTKLYSTYIMGIKQVIFPDNKVHTIFQQALTSTGRLSSIDPNLQNIPIRTPEGHLIRKMFIPDDGNMLYSIDYSQIELRVLAHMAGVKKLIEAFKNDEDIHEKTAKEIFKKDIIDPIDRRRAKAVNFGIVYGISAYGLAQDLGINNILAQEFIQKYYEAYPEINDFMAKTIDFCKNNGYVKTIENRFRYIPDINSKIYMQREFAKRMAMNAPIQGSAADIMKIAMIRVDNALERSNLKSKILVQVHDELVIDVYHGEEEIVKELVKNEMESAYELKVPLRADDSFGKNWYEVK